MTDAEVIERMLEVLNAPDKWCKDQLYDSGTDQYCLMGAFNMACFNNWHWPWNTTVQASRIIRILADAAREKGYHSERLAEESVVMFNNAPETTYEDVRLLLKEALTKV